MADVTYPRIKLVVNGQTFDSCKVTVKANGYYHADKFEACLPIWGGNGLSDNAWLALGSDGTNIPVQIYGGQGSATGSVTWNSDPMFDGILTDKVLEIDKNEIKISGVDKTQLLINFKLFKAYPNKSGAEVIQDLASKVGMTANVQGATALLGTLYSANHMKLHQGDFTKSATAWDLICEIARSSGNVAFVKGNIVYVQPNQPDQGQAWKIIYGEPAVGGNLAVWSKPSNVDTLSIHHNLLAAKDINVSVHYFHSRKGTPGTATAGTTKNRNTAGQSQYIFGPYPNMDGDQAQAKANELLRDLTIHEFTVTFDAPADFTLSPYKTVIIDGASGEMAQTFFVNELSFTTTVTAGARMSVTCKNHPPENDTQAS